MSLAIGDHQLGPQRAWVIAEAGVNLKPYIVIIEGVTAFVRQIGIPVRVEDGIAIHIQEEPLSNGIQDRVAKTVQ